MQKIQVGLFGRSIYYFWQFYKLYKIRRLFIMLALLVVLMFESAAIYGQWPKVYAQHSVEFSTHDHVSNIHNKNTSESNNIAVSASVDTPSSVIPSAPQCSPDYRNPQPSSIPLAPGKTGLEIVNDNPEFYQVYGYTAKDVLNEISTCSPVRSGANEYAASTNYTLNWQINYINNDGECRVSGAAVSIHIAQIYPHWNPSSFATAGYAGRWYTFMTNLQTHENGHRNLDEQYASRLVGDLESIPLVSCAELNMNANSIVAKDVSALNLANESYDALTNHGQTQGAVIPLY